MTWAQTRQLSLLEDPIDARFRAFHHDNPHVLERLVSLTYEWKAAGNTKCSMELLFAMLRWEHGVTTSGDQFKLNDWFTSRYARLIMALHPDLDGFFHTRVTRADREAP